MDAVEALKTRRSVRAFKKAPVDPKLIEDIVDCARLAPTARNVQPWEFVVMRDPAKLRELAQLTDHGRFIAEAPVCIAVLCKDTKYYLEDGSAATQNLLLAAHAHGLGACWVAGDKKPYAAKVAALLEAPEDYKLVSLVPLGYPADETPRRQKRPLKEVLHWDRF